MSMISKYKTVLTVLLVVVVVGGLGAIAAVLADTSSDDGAKSGRQAAGGDLAALYPYDTLAYANFGTSRSEFETLDAVLRRVQSTFPDDVLPADDQITLNTLLDMVAGELGAESFNDGIRPWLGNDIAVGLYSLDNMFDNDWRNDDDVPLLVAVSITSKADATAFVERRIQESFDGDWSSIEALGGTLFMFDGWQFEGVVLVRSDVLLLTTSEAYLPPDGGRGDLSLMTNPYYIDTLDLLPADEYSGLAYVDTPMLLANAVGTASSYDVDPATRFVATMIFRILAPTVVGFTNEGGDTLIMDVVQPLGNTTGLETLGMTFDPMPVADSEFLTNLPQDAALVIQGTDLAQTYESSLATGQTIADQLLGSDMLAEDELSPDVLALLNLTDMLLGNLTGFSYARDLRPWMQGSYAIYMGVDDTFDITTDVSAANFPVGWGAVFEVSDPEATRNFVTMLGRELQLTLRTQGAKGVAVNTTQVEGVDMVTVTISDYYDMPVVALAIAADDELIVFGTRNAVDAVLLDQGPRFDPDLPELLPEASIILYAGPPQFAPVVDWYVADTGATAEEADILRAALNVIQRATITIQSTPDGGGIMRATLTVGG